MHTLADESDYKKPGMRPARLVKLTGSFVLTSAKGLVIFKEKDKEEKWSDF